MKIFTKIEEASRYKDVEFKIILSFIDFKDNSEVIITNYLMHINFEDLSGTSLVWIDNEIEFYLKDAVELDSTIPISVSLEKLILSKINENKNLK